MSTYTELTAKTCEFDPTDYEEALAAFCARTYVLDKITPDPMSLVRGTGETQAALSALDLMGVTPHPVELMFYAEQSANPEKTDPIPRQLASFTRRFRGGSPSLRLGALLSGGLTAPRPNYGHVNPVDLEPRLTEAWELQRELGLELENMATLELPYTLDRALRMLCIPPTPTAEQSAPTLARPHLRWCIDAYQFALSG